MTEELQWTPPTPWCPNPAWWHADDSGATEDEVTELVAAFVRALQPEIVVETGAGGGHTTVAIGEALERNRHGHLYAVEIDATLAQEAHERTARLPVTVVCADSLEWAPPSPIGFAWIDSGIDVRQAEIRAWHSLFAPGAVIGVHDTGPQHPVRRLLGPLYAEGLLGGGFTLHTPRGVTFAQVRP